MKFLKNDIERSHNIQNWIIKNNIHIIIGFVFASFFYFISKLEISYSIILWFVISTSLYIRYLIGEKFYNRAKKLKKTKAKGKIDIYSTKNDILEHLIKLKEKGYTNKQIIDESKKYNISNIMIRITLQFVNHPFRTIFILFMIMTITILIIIYSLYFI